MATEHVESYSSLVEQTAKAEVVMPPAVVAMAAAPAAYGAFMMVDGGFVEVAAIADKWGERGEKAPSCEGFEGRGEEENQAVWVVRRHLTGPKQSTHGYMCRFCHRLYQVCLNTRKDDEEPVPFGLEAVRWQRPAHRTCLCVCVTQGGPQIIRAHVTGQAQGKNGGVRSRACTSPPATLKEDWSRPPLSQEERQQQKADRAVAKRLKAEQKKAGGGVVAVAAIQLDGGGGTKRNHTDDVMLSLPTDQV